MDNNPISSPLPHGTGGYIKGLDCARCLGRAAMMLYYFQGRDKMNKLAMRLTRGWFNFEWAIDHLIVCKGHKDKREYWLTRVEELLTEA